MKKTILTIALAIAFAIPFAGTADAYGERWYMVKWPQPVNIWKDGAIISESLCHVGKGQRLERIKKERDGNFIFVRVVGKPFLFWCKGWIGLWHVYNMDTVVQNLNYYRNLGDTVPVWQHSSSIWASRNKARSAPPLPKEIQYFINENNTKIWDGLNNSCTVGKGTKVRITRWIGDTRFIEVQEGPHKGCIGHLPGRKVSQAQRNSQWVHKAPKVCDITIGTKVHVFEDHFNGAARIKVINGPCYNREGWILSYTLKR